MQKKNQRVRRIRKWGDQLVIPINVFDQKDMELSAGDEVDISDIVVVKKSMRKDGNTKDNR